MKRFMIGLVLATLSGVATASAAQWVRGDGLSCDVACANHGDVAYSTGNYTNGNPFYLCRANPHGEGSRTGYNLRPNWANACVVGYGGKERFETFGYYCLCARDYPRP